MISPGFVIVILLFVFAWMGFLSAIVLALGIWILRKHG